MASSQERGQTALRLITEDEIEELKHKSILKVPLLLKSFGIPSQHIGSIADAVERVYLHNKIVKGEVMTVESAKQVTKKLMETDDEIREDMLKELRKFEELYRNHFMGDSAFTSCLSKALGVVDSGKTGLEKKFADQKEKLKSRTCPILVCGESSSGKSSFLNLLMRSKALPSAHMSCTFVVTVLKYGHKNKAKVYGYKESDNMSIEEDDTELFYHKISTIVFETAERTSRSKYKRVDIDMPVPYLESGIILIDTPGIGEHESVDQVLWDCIQEFDICACIYIVKSDNGTGVYPDRLGAILDKVKMKEKQIPPNMVLGFVPPTPLFVFNKWDLVPEDEKKSVKAKAVEGIKEAWPSLNEEMDICTMSVDRCQKLWDLGYIAEEYGQFLTKFEALMGHALNNNLRYSLRFLATLFDESLHLASSFIRKTNTDRKSYQEAITKAKDALKEMKKCLPMKFSDMDRKIKEQEKVLVKGRDSLHDYMNRYLEENTDFTEKAPLQKLGQSWEGFEQEIDKAIYGILSVILTKWDNKFGQALVDQLSGELKRLDGEVQSYIQEELSKVDQLLEMQDAKTVNFSMDQLMLSAWDGRQLANLEKFYQEMTIPKRIGLALSTVFWAPVVLLKKPKLPVFKSIFFSIDSAKDAWNQYTEEERFRKYNKHRNDVMKKKLARAIERFLTCSSEEVNVKVYVAQRLQGCKDSFQSLQGNANATIEANRQRISTLEQDQRSSEEIRKRYGNVEGALRLLNQRIQSICRERNLVPGFQPVLK